MTFEPLIHANPLLATLQVLLLALGTAASVGLISYLVFYLPVRNKKSLPSEKRKDLKNFFWIMVGFGLFFGVIFGGTWSYSQRIYQNENIVRANLAEKYFVDEVIFAPRGRGVPNVAYPEQSEEQTVTIKSSGKSRLALLTQDRETSEPTLSDVDTKLPMDDIRR